MSDETEAASLHDEKIARIVAHLIRYPGDHWRVLETIEDLDFSHIQHKARELETSVVDLLVKARVSITAWITKIPLEQGERDERLFQLVHLIDDRLHDMGVCPRWDDTQIGQVQVHFDVPDVLCELISELEKAGIEIYPP